MKKHRAGHTENSADTVVCRFHESKNVLTFPPDSQIPLWLSPPILLKAVSSPSGCLILFFEPLAKVLICHPEPVEGCSNCLICRNSSTSLRRELSRTLRMTEGPFFRLLQEAPFKSIFRPRVATKR